VSAPARQLSLRKNFYWTFAGNAVYAGCQWAMLMALAKLCRPEQVGLFALGLATTAPILMLTNLQLRAVQATDARDEHPFAEYLALRLLGTALALLVAIVVAFAVGRDPLGIAVIIAVAVAKGVESISDIVYGLFQSRESLDLMATSMLIKGPLSLAALACLVWLSRDVLLGTLGLVAAWTLVLFAYDLPLAAKVLGGWKFLRPVFRAGTSLRLLRTALPLGLVMMIVSLTNNVPRYFVERDLGARDLGFFAALSAVTAAGVTVVGALGQSATPRMARLFANGDRAGFVRLVLRLAGVGGLLALAGVAVAALAGEPLLRLIYTAEYASHARTFLVINLAAGIGYVASFLGYAITAARQFVAQTPLSLAVGASTALSAWWLVPRLGIVGAAWATGCGMAVQLLGEIWICRRAVALMAEMPLENT
jgi:O-antigen/teichoic acid export membrane protein